MLTILQGDCRDVLPTLPADSVHCVVTSPPYWGLRDYGVDRQLGLERTPEEFVENMVGVFREVRRVMRDDATLWMNFGDAFLDKQLVGMPWRVAFALQADGWWLRSAITWCKRSPMPESVTDRPAKATEMLFLLTKRARYFYDTEAVRVKTEGGTRNLWDYWILGPEPFISPLKTVDHFAVFPRKLVEPCLKAGTSERGCCPECGAPWRRVVELGEVQSTGGSPTNRKNSMADFKGSDMNSGEFTQRAHLTTGWTPTCDHEHEPVPCTVMDPFFGSGTVGEVAQNMSLDCIGIELSEEYIRLAKKRLEQGVLF
jgi:site-specific DNA-methyltransferase (adenine-specific)